MCIRDRLYSQANPQGAASEQTTTADGSENVVHDADYKVEDDNKQ